jgi:hypothetical protein
MKPLVTNVSLHEEATNSGVRHYDLMSHATNSDVRH